MTAAHGGTVHSGAPAFKTSGKLAKRTKAAFQRGIALPTMNRAHRRAMEAVQKKQTTESKL